MELKLDTHTHTVASGHAYCTLNEMVKAASVKGLELMATTDHAPQMPGGAHLYHFYNLRVIPKYIDGVRVLKGVEANIIDFKGSIDMPTEVLSELDLVIASFHGPCLEPSNIVDTTDSLIKVMDNPHVNIIGHPEDRRYAFDIKSVVSVAKESSTLLEVNNSSLLPTTFREGSREGIIKILEECGKQDVKVVLGSDAHHTSSVGRFSEALKVIKDIGFSKELIINRSTKDFLEYIGVDK